MSVKKLFCNKNIATLLSVLFHPVFMPLAATLFLLYSHTYLSYLPASIKYFDLILIFLNTLLIPLVYMFLFLRIGVIRSLNMETKRERFFPLSLFTVFSFATFIVLKKVNQPVVLYDLFLAITIISFLTLLISLQWKISLHLIGIGVLSGIFFSVSYRLYHNFLGLWLISLILAGFLGTARLELGQHRPSEIYSGFLFGFLGMTGLMLLL